INPVYSIAASPDGNTIFVAETHTGQEAGDTLISDLQPGTSHLCRLRQAGRVHLPAQRRRATDG
ncbi:MAG: hypothetical protein AAF638_14170, partial [Pseudomonadota bacterium]